MTSSTQSPLWLINLLNSHGERVRELAAAGVGRKSIAKQLGVTEHKIRRLCALMEDPEPPVVGVDVTDDDEAPGFSYEFRESTGEYVFNFPGCASTMVLSADRVRQMKIDYTSWDGSPQTMEHVAMANGLTTNEFFGIKRAMGWRKDSLPLLDEDMRGLSESDIAERLFVLKKRGAEIKAKRMIWNQIEQKAIKYDQITTGTLDPFDRALDRLSISYTPSNITYTDTKPQGDWALVYSPTDLHYGKYHWARYGGGPLFDRERCRTRLMEATQNLIDRLPSRPEVVISCIGSDWFNADNVHAKTTSFKNTMDMDGVSEQMWEEGMALCLDVHEAIRPVGKELWIVLQRGNHDDMLSGALFSVLQAYFRNDPSVKFHDGRGVYNYLTYGNSLLGVTHGHGEHRAEKLANIMAHERPKMWGETKYRYFLTGNLHHHAVHESGGVVCFLLPSLTGADRYHVRQGYMMARPGLMGLCFDKQTGYMGNIFGHVSDEHIPVPDDEFSGRRG